MGATGTTLDRPAITGTSRVDVAVIGAGPFGLSVAAHLAESRRVRVFGPLMRTWRELMPPDMLLRSDWSHTNLSAPEGRGTLDEWAASTGETPRDPLPLRLFLDYADWFVGRYVPELTEDWVSSIERDRGGFVVSTASGERVAAANVVLALGVTPFPRIPRVFRGCDRAQTSLAEGHGDTEDLAGRSVVVVGGGQNGLEAALRAKRGGAERVDIVVRSRVRWFADHEPYHDRGPVRERIYRAAYPIVGFGPPPINRLVQHPELFARLPEALRERLNRRLLRPGGSPWLRDQLAGNVHLHEGTAVERLDETATGVTLRLSNGRTLAADHVVVACGYQFDLGRIACLSEELRGGIQLRQRSGWPVLTSGLATTCPGLYFAGFPTEGQFGPMSRFVEGTRFAAERCAASITRG